jgi:hypothetical protein
VARKVRERQKVACLTLRSARGLSSSCFRAWGRPTRTLLASSAGGDAAASSPGARLSSPLQSTGAGSPLCRLLMSHSRVLVSGSPGLLWLAGSLLSRCGWDQSDMISTIRAEDALDAGARLGEISALTTAIGGGCDRFYPTEGYINNAIASRLYLSPRLYATMSRASSPSWKYPIAPRQSSTPAGRAGNERRFFDKLTTAKAF